MADTSAPGQRPAVGIAGQGTVGRPTARNLRAAGSGPVVRRHRG